MSLVERARSTARESLPTPVVEGARRGRTLWRRVGEATSQAALTRLVRRTSSLHAAAQENAAMLPDLERRVAALEQAVAGAAQRFLDARTSR